MEIQIRTTITLLENERDRIQRAIDVLGAIIGRITPVEPDPEPPISSEPVQKETTPSKPTPQKRWFVKVADIKEVLRDSPEKLTHADAIRKALFDKGIRPNAEVLAKMLKAGIPGNWWESDGHYALNED